MVTPDPTRQPRPTTERSIVVRSPIVERLPTTQSRTRAAERARTTPASSYTQCAVQRYEQPGSRLESGTSGNAHRPMMSWLTMSYVCGSWTRAAYSSERMWV